MKELTSAAEFQQEVLEKEGIVLVDFNADWCPPCQAQKPILEKMTDEYSIFGLNIDDLEDIAREYQVASIPCMILFKDGKEVDRLIGLNSEKKIKKFIEQ